MMNHLARRLTHGVSAFMVLLSSAGFLQAITFNRGGVTFPMEEISHRRFSSTGDTQANLLDNSQLKMGKAAKPVGRWRGSTWIFQAEARKQFAQQARTIANARIAMVDGTKVLVLDRPAKLEELMGEAVASFSSSFNQLVKLPDRKGGTYQLRFDSRSQLLGKRKHSHMVLMWFRDGSKPALGSGKETRSYLYRRIVDEPKWQANSIDIQVPENTRDVWLYFRGDGCGKLLIRSPRLVKLTADKQPVSVEFAPGGLLDNTYVLASGAPGPICFKFRNNLPLGTLPADGFTFNLELPEPIAVKGTNCYFGKDITFVPITMDGKPARCWRVSCDPVIPEIKDRNDFDGWDVPAAVLFGHAPAGTRWENCRYYVTHKGKRISDMESFTLLMSQPMAKIAPPKQFFCGFSSVEDDLHFQQDEAEELVAKFIAETGTTLVAGSVDRAQMDSLRRHGIPLLTSESSFFANGYRLGVVEKKDKPSYAIFRDKDGKPVPEWRTWGTCPTAVYNKTPYYDDVIVPQLKNDLDGLDGLQPNWEPFMFDGRGCFCDNCRSEFARFAGISQEKVKEIWPAQLMPGQPYRDLAIRFRSYQHGRVIKTLFETSQKLGAKAIGFCPEVGSHMIIDYPQHKKEVGEHEAYAYADSLKWLNVWGPYVWIRADEPYRYSKGSHLLTWETLKRVVRDFRRHYPQADKRPKLMSMTHGNQCNMMALGQPEGMVMDLLCAFLVGYDAAELYFFPRGYDHRYWRALASCNAIIANHEDMVMNGRRSNLATAVPVTSFPGPLDSVQPKYLPDIRSTELLQVQTFTKGDANLVAIGNFWEKGDVICTMKVPGLELDKKYVVMEKEFQRQFVRDSQHVFTGRELAEGILVHVGALRWAFFDIVPEGQEAAGMERVTAARMKQELIRCQKDTREAANEEAARDRQLYAEQNIGEIQSLNHKRMSCKPVTVKGKPCMEITGGKDRVLINPKGMMIDVWTVDGKELNGPGCGISAFWCPGPLGMVADQNFQMTHQKISDHGFQASGTMVTNARTYPQLSGLKIVKTIDVTPDFRKLTVSVRLYNTQAEEMSHVGYRWLMFPAAWSKGERGSIRCGGQELQRPGTCSLFALDACDPESEKTVRKLFQVTGPTKRIAGKELQMGIGSGSSIRVSFLPADQFLGIASWDTQATMTTATCEPFYKAATIPPGGSISYSMILESRLD